jgi:CBS domain-containing protein
MNDFLTAHAGNLSGVVSERDYVKKIALLGKKSKEVLVKQISTKAADLITVSPNDTVDACMQKMLSRDIRHLPLVDDEGNVVGIVSIKDLIKTCLEEKEHTIEQLASFAVGEGGHFVM